MAYDELLADRIREILDGRADVRETKMFGGLVFMVRGHMSFGIIKNELMVRVGEENLAGTLERPHVRPMDFTGTPSRRMVYVGRAGFKTKAALSAWVDRATAYAETLPPKAAKTKPRKARPRRR